MIYTRNRRSLFTFILTILFILSSLPLKVIEAQTDSLLEVQEKLTRISEEERKVIEDLFILLQEIEAAAREEERVQEDIEEINTEIESLEQAILEGTVQYERKREDLEQVLKSYQRMGAGSYFKILMESDSLSMLIRRINLLRDITRNTGKLLEELDEGREKLNIEKAHLEEKLQVLEEKQEELRESLSKKIELRGSMESYLASMEEERAYYEEHLKDIQRVWEDLKLTLAQVTREFYRIVEEENLPPNAMKITLSLAGIKGSMDEGTFNHIIKEYSNLPEMTIKFQPGKIDMAFPEKNLVLIGRFSIVDKNKLQFEAGEGRFYDMPLERSSLEELFKEGHIVLDLQPLIGNSTLRSIEVLEEYIELVIIPELF